MGLGTEITLWLFLKLLKLIRGIGPKCKYSIQEIKISTGSNSNCFVAKLTRLDSQLIITSVE